MEASQQHDHPAPSPAISYPQRLLALLDGTALHGTALHGTAAPDPDRPVFEHGSRVVTAAEMLDLVARAATGLRRAGIGPGDGLGVLLGVTPEAFAVITAGYVVGARVSGMRADLPPHQLAHLLGDVAAVLVDSSTAATARAALNGTGPSGTGLAMLAVGSSSSARDDGGTGELTDVIAVAPDGDALVCTARPDDVARVVHTSGSTGMPKGCEQTYRGLASGWTANPGAWPPVIRELAARLQRYLVFGSLASMVMAEYSVITLAAGGTLVAADPPAFPQAFARYRATASVITVPRLNRMVADQRTDPVDLTSLRALMVSGSPLDPHRLAEAIEVLGPVVFHGYGQTETSMISMVGPAEMQACPAALDSVGIPPDVTSVRIVGPDGNPVPDGAVGELFVRTPGQAAGYRDDPAQTAEVFVDGWVRTRDLARRDPDGRLHLVDRARDVVIVNAELVYPGAVARVLGTHPDVAEAHALGAPSEETGEAVHAFVVPRPGARPGLDALRAQVAAALGRAAVPVTITVLDQVPISAAGKPDHQLLRTLVT